MCVSAPPLLLAFCALISHAALLSLTPRDNPVDLFLDTGSSWLWIFEEQCPRRSSTQGFFEKLFRGKDLPRLTQDSVCGRPVLKTKFMGYLDGAFTGKVIQDSVFVAPGAAGEVKDTFLLVNTNKGEDLLIDDPLLGRPSR